MYALVYFVFIPKTAALLTPFKWKSIAPGQKRESYLAYLGRPGVAGGRMSFKEDTWSAKRGNYDFYLTIHYNEDTVGNSVDMYYQFHNGLFYKTENLSTGSF